MPDPDTCPSPPPKRGDTSCIACGRNGVLSVETLTAIWLSQVLSAPKGSERKPEGTSGQSAGKPKKFPLKPSNAARLAPCSGSQDAIATEKSQRNAFSRSGVITNPPGGGKLNAGMWTVSAPEVTVIPLMTARAIVGDPSAKSSVMFSASAVMETPATAVLAGTGASENAICWPPSNATRVSPDAGRSNASSSHSHVKFHGALTADARSPRRSCCGSAALWEV